jgi:hypothetical protein
MRATFFVPACTLWGRNEARILNFPTITAQQIAASLLAVPAFLLATLCTGYLAAWFTDLHDFRKRFFVERIFWSVPLSLAISTIAAVLIGKFLPLAWRDKVSTPVRIKRQKQFSFRMILCHYGEREIQLLAEEPPPSASSVACSTASEYSPPLLPL